MEQIFDISLRPLDRGEFQMEGLKTDAARKGGDHLNDLKMDRFFADNALLSDLLTPCLKLRLN